MGRRSVWSDPRLIEAAQRFVPVADEVWRLQTGDDPECLTFQAMADGGHYRGKGGTRQGIYVCTPAGALLASINSNSPERVLEMIERGWSAWEALSDDERERGGSQIEPATRVEDDFPDDGLALESTGRDLPDGERGTRWNRDHVWYSKEEARGFVPADPVVGDRHEVPEALVRRLARFHLVDDVRGQSVPYAAQEIELAQLEAEVVAMDGSRVRLSLRGKTRANAPGPWQMGESIFRPRSGTEHPHGMSTDLLGSAVFDLANEQFSAFELVARGERWGRTINNGRRGDVERSSIGFVFRIAPPGSARRVPPAFAVHYDAPWLAPAAREDA